MALWFLFIQGLAQPRPKGLLGIFQNGGFEIAVLVTIRLSWEVNGECTFYHHLF